MVLQLFVGCANKSIIVSNCPPVIIPSTQAIADVISIKDTKPELYHYIDKIGIRERFIYQGCQD